MFVIKLKSKLWILH